MADQKLIDVRVVTPRGDILIQKARTLSSKNSSGKFDILPEHANFVTMIEDQPIFIIDPQGKEIKVQYKLAILHAFSNKVNIYTDIQKVEVV